MKRIILPAIVAAALSGAAHAQIYYDQYGNRVDMYRGTTTPNPMFEPPQTFTVPSLPQVPDVSRGIGEGPGPYGTALPSGASGYPCTMPGCR